MPNLTLSHAATDILTLVLNMTLIDSDKNKQDGGWIEYHKGKMKKG